MLHCSHDHGDRDRDRDRRLPSRSAGVPSPGTHSGSFHSDGGGAGRAGSDSAGSSGGDGANCSGKQLPLGMLMRGFPLRSTDSSIRDGLFHEYKKFGRVTSVSVIGSAEDRHAIVSFKKYVSLSLHVRE